MEEKVQNKLPYEELEKLANDLFVKLRMADLSNLFKRLDYLFKVVKYKESFSTEFVNNSIAEIEELLIIKKEEE